MRYFHRRPARFQMVINPPGEQRGLHAGHPWLWQLLHPLVQRLTGRRNRDFLDNRAICPAHTAADALFVDVQANVIHSVHKVLLGSILKHAFGPAFSFFHQESLTTALSIYNQTNEPTVTLTGPPRMDGCHIQSLPASR